MIVRGLRRRAGEVLRQAEWTATRIGAGCRLQEARIHYQPVLHKRAAGASRLWLLVGQASPRTRRPRVSTQAGNHDLRGLLYTPCRMQFRRISSQPLGSIQDRPTLAQRARRARLVVPRLSTTAQAGQTQLSGIGVSRRSFCAAGDACEQRVIRKLSETCCGVCPRHQGGT